MIKLLLVCYPARWRERYGEEFAFVLESRPLGPFDVVDVLLGALDARLHLRGLGAASAASPGSGAAMSQRIGGWAAIVGGTLWLIVALGQVQGSGDGGPLVGLVLLGASMFVLIALAGLSAFQARRHPRLVWAAFAIPAVGSLASIAGLVGHAIVGDAPFIFGLSTWYLWMTGVLAMMFGSALFAAATWRVRTLSRAASALLFVGSVLIFPAMLGMIGLAAIPAEIALVASLIIFATGWIATGSSALRAGRSAVIGLVP